MGVPTPGHSSSLILKSVQPVAAGVVCAGPGRATESAEGRARGPTGHTLQTLTLKLKASLLSSLQVNTQFSLSGVGKLRGTRRFRSVTSFNLQMRGVGALFSRWGS